MHSNDLWSLLVTVCNVYILVNKLFYDVLTVQCDDIRGRNEWLNGGVGYTAVV